MKYKLQYSWEQDRIAKDITGGCFVFKDVGVNSVYAAGTIMREIAIRFGFGFGFGFGFSFGFSFSFGFGFGFGLVCSLGGNSQC
jgi:hypothetical protein